MSGISLLQSTSNHNCFTLILQAFINLEPSTALMAFIFVSYFFKDFIHLFLERGRERESGGEKHQCVVASHVSPTEDLARKPGRCPDWELNQQPLASQAGIQSTEPPVKAMFCFLF